MGARLEKPGRPLHAPLVESREQPPNSARFAFLGPAAQEFFVDWEKAAKDLVATLRLAGRPQPLRPRPPDLVGELSAGSDAFRAWWAAHNVRYHHTGTERLHHPVVGDLELSYEVMVSRPTQDYDWRSSPPNPARAPSRPSTSSPPRVRAAPLSAESRTRSNSVALIESNT